MLLALTTTVVLGAGVWFLSRAKRLLEADQPQPGEEPLGSHAKFLAENWGLIERTALEHGMTADELADVRRKVFASEESTA